MRARVIACATVIEELRPWLPASFEARVLDFGLHTRPESLRAALQSEVDAATDVDVVLLGYGMCSRAVIGVRAGRAPLVMPRVHDCIALFLGSHRAYTEQARAEPGTYYLTSGWVAVGDSPLQQVDTLALRHGRARARRMVGLMLRHYTRLAFIDTGTDPDGTFREHARAAADEFALGFEEIDGAPDLARKLVEGPWQDGELVMVGPGEVVTAEMFAQPVARESA
jgi:hypothetical protein